MERKNYYKIMIYEGRLGSEHFLTSVDATNWPWVPAKGEMIALGDEAAGTDEVYDVIGVLTDVAKRSGDDDDPYELQMFVKRHVWED